MAHHWSDNVHTTAFSPRDYQVELLACAREQNIIICLGHNSSKEFIALKLIHELGHELRRNNDKKITFYLSNNNGDSAYNLIYHLTDLKIINLKSEHNFDYETDFEKYHVIILNPESFLNILICGYVTLDEVNLIIIEDCHRKAEGENNYLSEIFNNYYVQCTNKPKVLGLAGPLHSAGCPPGRLGAELEHLEKAIHCRAETASDIVTVLRYCSKPIEIILQCAPPRMNELTEFIYNLVLTKKAFLNDHRFDPSEIYSDEFLEELKGIPDPKIDPLQYLDDFLLVLTDLGPWCADRASFLLLLQLEKQKIKTPYERHYLLLCLITTTLIEIRAHCSYVFQKLLNEKERVEQYSTPKVLRILEILRLYKPNSNKDENTKYKKNNYDNESKKLTSNDDNINKVIKEIENLNFKGLKKKSEEIKNKIENEKSTQFDKIKEKLDNITKPEFNLKNEESKEMVQEIIENKKGKIKDAVEVIKHPINIQSNSLLNKRSLVTSNKYEPRHYRHRKKYGQHTRNNRNNYNNANDSELLCGIIFCNSRFMAKILFSLFHEMSRNDTDLNYLNVQYTVDKVANPQTEIKEAETEHKKQEEVLKKFRMHECNLLIGTSVLEEGIDLPKCNLVIRWDPPITYRSYVQCKGRARAPQAYYIIMVAPTMVNNSRYNDDCEILTNKNHKFACHPGVIKNNYKKIKMKNSMFKGCSNKFIPCEALIKYENKKIVADNNIINSNDRIEEIITNGVEDKIEEIITNGVEDKIDEIITNGVENKIEEIIAKKVDDKVEVKDVIVGNCPNGITDHVNTELSIEQEAIKNKYFDSSDEESSDDSSENDTESLKSCCADREYISSDEYVVDENYYDKLLDNMNVCTEKVITRLAQYIEIEKMLLRKCENIEPLEYDLLYADQFTPCILPYKPLMKVSDGASVNLSTAVALVNKYCAKLPSDTFTKLTPLWRYAKTLRNNIEMFQCTLRLPINSPLKEDIVGLPMPTRILARRVAALIASKILHKSGELDDNLQPIGKEGFRASESDWENFELEKNDELIVNDNSEPRPGTTKRRQYYYKRIASAFSNCRPKVGEKAYLYHISMVLQCPIPEEQNTRGRKIYPPEDARQHFGILTLKKIPKISAFPIFTRSGEVKVSLELVKDDVLLEESQLLKVYTFINYTFTNVLRLQKYLMLFDPDATENCFFIVPTIKNETIEVDWDFLDLITNNSDKTPQPVSEDDRKVQGFDANIFKDAVVMPWYRNQDQPQYFYVAEICYHLSPESSFPGENYTTFQEYYYRKYSIEIQNRKQPLLDVDHTSARLNFLTPRYVNRKGVALPTSSEETKRAKRENLEQKQILVPELCTIHPFTASLWRAAVCLPCILYRINALLLADEIRKKVSNDLGLGKIDIIDNLYEWPSLDFGWSLADVLKKSRESKQLIIEDVEEELNDTPQTKKREEKHTNKEKVADNESPIEEVNEKTANEILEEVDRKIKNECTMEIGTWSNEMADNISMNDDLNEDDWGLLPPNVNMCSGSQIRYGSPTSWDYGTNNVNPIDPYYSDSDTSFQSDEDYDNTSVASNDEQNFKLHIEFKSDNLAEAIETEEEILKRKKQMDIINNTNANEIIYQNTKNICVGFDTISNSTSNDFIEDNFNNVKWHENEFLKSTEKFENDIRTSNVLVKYDESLKIVKSKEIKRLEKTTNKNLLKELIPYNDSFKDDVTSISLEDLYEINKIYSSQHGIEKFTIEGSGNIFDNFNDKLITDYKDITIDFSKDLQIKNLNKRNDTNNEDKLYEEHLNEVTSNEVFNFDYQPNLVDHPGPSPSIILQALTMSNANDGINLERLETIGDSFLKYAITTYLYCTYENVHEGKLSHLRSKQVSNLNLYRLGRRKILGESMIATKFEPHDNWLPPCYYVPRELEQALIEAKIPACHWDLSDMPNLKDLSSDEICKLVKRRAVVLGVLDDIDGADNDEDKKLVNKNETTNFDNFPFFIPYNLVTQHSIPDKSVADCVEALIGAYLIECGPRGALLFMAWLGIRVLPVIEMPFETNTPRIPGSIISKKDQDKQIVYGKLVPPKSPLLCFVPNPHETLELLLDGYTDFENAIGYHFNDRSYLLQAMTHASYSPNRLTDCYQRLEFLGDAVLDYLITRHLYEDPRQHSPGALTDLRSALVNNTIFASLAVRHNFHKYFRHLSPGLNEVIERFVRIQHENGHSISEEYYLISEEECDEAEDVEVPKALGDVFESVAGAIFLDSNMSLDTVWKVYSNMMRPEIEQFSNSVPKSPIRELLELEPETAKFGKPEKLADGRRVRVTVEVFGKGTFRGIGRNYRIAKCTAAKCALRQLKKQGLITKKH